MNSLYAAAGAIVTNIIYGFIPWKPSGFMGIGVKFGAAYLTGYIAERFMNPQKAQMMAVGGAASAAGDLIQQLMGTVQGFGQSIFAPAPAPAEVGGLYDIVAAPPFYDTGVGGLGDVVEAPGFYQYQ